MLKSIFIAFVLITSISYAFASGRFDGIDTDWVVQTPGVGIRHAHNPYRKGPLSDGIPLLHKTVTVVECSWPRNVQMVTFLAEMTYSSETISGATQCDILAHIDKENRRLKSITFSKQLIRDYGAFISYCKNISQDPSYRDIRLELQNSTAYALLGLSNVYGKMKDNENKFETAKEAFLLYAELHQSGLLTRWSPQYRAGTCLFAMNQAVVYLFKDSLEDAARSLYNKSLQLVERYVENGIVKEELLKHFGRQTVIQNFRVILARVRLKTT